MKHAVYDINSLRRLIVEHDEQNHIEFESKRLILVSDLVISKFKNISRVNMVSIILCTEGELKANINFREFDVHPGMLIFYQPNQYFQILTQTNNCHAKILFISPKLVEEILTHFIDLMDVFFYVNENPCMQLSDIQKDMILSYLKMISLKSKEVNNIFYKEIYQNLLKALFFEVCNIYSQNIVSKNIVRTRQDFIFEKFLHEVMINFKRERSIKFYAEKIGITPKYLSSICKDVSGRYAGNWIENFVIAEAKILLRNSQLTIQQISNELNFPNQSVFGKYFRTHVGVSPKEFKNKD